MEVLRFEEIVGQDHALGLLKRALKNRRLPHAYLFVGPEGVGRETTARALFLRLVCTQEQGCGECPGCRKFLKGLHPDVEILTPPGQKIKIDQIRDLEQKLRFVPLEASYRLILIPKAEALTREAANALLKSLEEPPPYTLFVLLAPSPDVLLPTIVSRTQIIRFRPIPLHTLQDLLVSRFGKLPEEAEGLALLAQGSVGRALRLSEKGFLEELTRLVHVIAEHDPAKLISLTETLAHLKDQLPVFLELVLVWLRQSLRAHLGLEPYPALFPPSAPSTIVVSALELVEKTLKNLEFNVNRELALLALLLRLKELWSQAHHAEIPPKGTGPT